MRFETYGVLVVKAKSGERLVRELMANPRRFKERGRSYQLLQACFEGFPPNALRPLLEHKDVLVVHAAIFVAAELGWEARDLVEDVVPLVGSKDRYVRYHALEVLVVCCTGERAGGYVHVIQALDGDDAALHVFVMRWVCNADTSQLEAGAQFYASAPTSEHQVGLSLLLLGEQADQEQIMRMIGAVTPLCRRYGAIAAYRVRGKYPELMRAVVSSDDAELREFARSLLRKNRVRL